MARNQHHVVPCDKGWSIKRSGAERASAITESKAEAIKIGRIISERQRSQLIIHGENGQIQSSEAPHSEKSK